MEKIGKAIGIKELTEEMEKGIRSTIRVFEFEDGNGTGIIIAESEKTAIEAYKKMFKEHGEKPEMKEFSIREMKIEEFMRQVFVGAGYGE